MSNRPATPQKRNLAALEKPFTPRRRTSFSSQESLTSTTLPSSFDTDDEAHSTRQSILPEELDSFDILQDEDVQNKFIMVTGLDQGILLTDNDNDFIMVFESEQDEAAEDIDSSKLHDNDDSTSYCATMIGIKKPSLPLPKISEKMSLAKKDAQLCPSPSPKTMGDNNSARMCHSLPPSVDFELDMLEYIDEDMDAVVVDAQAQGNIPAAEQCVTHRVASHSINKSTTFATTKTSLAAITNQGPSFKSCASMSVSDAGIFALEDEELKKEFEKVDRGEKSILSIPSNLYKFIGPDRSLFSKCIVLWWILLDVSDRRELIKGSWRHSDSTRRAMLDKLQQINHLVKQMTSRMNTQQIEKLSPQLRPFVLGVAKRIFKYERTQASVDQWKLESFLDKYCLEDWIKIGKFVPKGGPPGMDCQNEDGSKPKDDQVVDEMKDLEDDMRRISIGEINNGQIMKGEQRYEDGSSYKGTFRNGLMHGQGCFKYSDGRTIYQGNYCNGFAHGYGEQLKDNGSSGYKGIWEYDKMSEGLLHYVDSDGKTVYNGEIKDGEFHGNGELTLTNGACYKGSFVNGMYDGQGKFTWSSSQWYEGTFRQDKPHGYGESMCDGNGYKGNFVNGEFNGQGKLTLSNGDWCKGEFKEGKFQNGFGKLTYVDGSLYEGNLLNDKYEGQGKVSMSDGDWYKGEFKEDKFLYGYGKVTWIDGNSYEGSFLNGKFEGQGKYIWSNGNCYEGEFKDGNFHGAGKLKLCDGTCREGTFADDEFVDGFFTDFHPDGTLRRYLFWDGEDE